VAKLKIDGVEYEFPSIDSVTLDEAVMLERYAGVGLEQLAPGTALPLGAVKGLILIAIRRVRPDVTERELAERIGQLKLAELQDVFQEDADSGDAGPPAVASSGSGASTERSGAVGSNGGAATPEPSTPPGIGSQGSDTGRVSDRATSVG
jgi:hypothetical protein